MHRLIRYTERLCLRRRSGASALLKNANRRLTCNITKRHSSTEQFGSAVLPESARVVICGGGVVGTSLAYHLTLLGWSDVVLLEQGSLTCGTTWHAAGQVTRLRWSAVETALTMYSTELYQQLEDEGYHTGWKKCGSINVARTDDRLLAYKRALVNAKPLGIEGQILSPEQVKDRIPMLRTDDIKGGIWLPDDGVVNPTDLTMALAKKAREGGVKIVERCKVQRVQTENDMVSAVVTDQGSIACKFFVNCAGQWAWELGQLCDQPVRVPLHPCAHFYLVTKPFGDINPMMPVVRDFDGYIYLREWGGGILGGGFEPMGKPVFHDGIPPKFEFELLNEDWDQFQILLEQLLHRLPGLQAAEVKQFVNGPESFTPDGRYILGHAPEVGNYYVAAGMNATGVMAAGGVGKAMAEWIVNGETDMFLWSQDVRRFAELHNNKKFLRARVKETTGATMSCAGPDIEYESGRGVRTSPLYTRLQNSGAIFGQIIGFEPALYFDSPSVLMDTFSETRDERQAAHSSFGKPAWFDQVKAEYWACREGVCLIDMSTFTKFELMSAGNEVVDFLQYVCSNDIDKPIGSIMHTGMQNHSGGFENDCSIVRLAHNKFFMIGPTAQQIRSFAWLKRHLPKDGSVQLNDVTSMYTSINVIGPKARQLLTELTDTPLDKNNFPSMTYKEIDVAQASQVKAMRLTHTGEDGWMLYIPSEYALHVYDSLMAAGKNYGIRNAGYYALRALRMEKFFAYWGTDLTPQVTPIECGRESRVKFHIGGFIGCPALLHQRSTGIKKRLAQFLLEDHDTEEDTWPWGGEPIYRNGKFCGTVTSTTYGFTLDRHVCMGYVQDFDEKTGEPNIITNDFVLRNAKYTIDIAGKRFSVKSGIYPPTLVSAAIVIGSG
ncbi:hypothetical protein NP493_106g05056 [Ridgeia piscesae]|uniref:Pyruvate dehydrogenase phosphatase regulatory subunit, mitochondrial n=1 Tax=Ridgeia piscesae TaxID=27915 RepID=A0AAD9UH90_RIDPI|nr:hypothetical protein NP493_106g05056 [Ridgeia piscesae]